MTKPNQRGFVSLMTAILLSLLLLAITVSLVGLQTLTLRKAEDSEQSQRAYYAAESGVEDGIARVNTGVVAPGSDQSACSQNLGFTVGTSVLGWSCQTITFSGSPSNDIKLPDVAQNIDPAGTTFDSVRLLWNQTSRHADTDAAYYSPPATGATGITAGWGDRAMPLELTVVKYPTGNFNASAIKTQTILLMPAPLGSVSDPVTNTTSSAHVAYSDKLLYQVNTSGVGNGGCSTASTGNCGIDTNSPYKAYCGQEVRDPSGTGEYHCEIVMVGLPSGFNYLFRVRSRYVADDGAGSGQFAMNFYSGGTLEPIQDSTATIDVTGQAGTVFRRVIYKLPVGNVASGTINEALFSEVGICQNYQVLENVGTGVTSQVGSCP